MKWLPALAAGVLAAAGCASLAPRRTSPPPLETEGELYVYAEPLRDGASAVAVELASAGVLRDGLVIPLELVLHRLAPDGAVSSTLFATARLLPGRYDGFALHVKRATRQGSQGEGDLLLPEQPLHVDAPFTVQARRATVLRLAVRPPGSDGAVELATSFAIEPPAKTVLPLLGLAPATDAHGVVVFDKRARDVTSVWPSGREPWGVALDVIGNRAFVSLSGQDELAVFDLLAGEERARIRLTPGDAPRELALTPDRRTLVVANAGSNSVSFVDPASLIEVGRVPATRQPTSVLLDRAGTRAYVFGERSNEITVVDVANRAVVATVSTESAPLRGQLDRAGTRLFVADAASHYLTIYSVPDLAVVRRLFVGLGTTAIKVDPATDLLYVANSIERRLQVFDPFSLIAVGSVPLGAAVDWMAIDDAENALLLLSREAGAVTVVDLATRKPVTSFAVGPGARVLAVSGERY
jgi:YVTN family beta-propeller protein